MHGRIVFASRREDRYVGIGLRALGIALVLSSLALVTGPARADEQARTLEEPDATRLDVERLPVEALEVTRDLYAHGFFLEAHVGTRGFLGGLGKISRPGLMASFGFGYEIARWLWLKAAVEASFHPTDAPPPPSATVFELVGGVVELRFQWDLSARVALWLGVEGGVVISLSDVLVTYGFEDSDSFGFMYGGQLGVDWHMRNRHHSLGLAAGARLYPSLEGPGGELPLGAHGTAYLRYVF